MKKMTKREQILAQKTIDARRVKNESRSPSRHGGLSQSLSPNKRSHFRSLSGFSNRRPATSMETMNRSFAGTIDEDMFNRSGPPSYRDDNDALTKELAQRGLTHQATVRKMTNEALARTAKQDIRVDDRSDIFLPKVRKVRPDGATLADVYRSKKEDVWGKILREQIAEEERNNIRKRAEKEAADAAYGEKLREQLAIKSHLERTQVFGGDVMANSTGGTWAQFEERNRLREAQRSVKHKQFVENALHDMNVKKKRKEEELQQELESSAYVVRKAQMELEAEKEKARRQKEQQAKEMSRLFEENQAILAKRQREREENHKRDRKYVKELDDKFRIEDERRKAEVDRKAASNSTDRGTFLMAKKIHEEAKRKEQELMETFVKAENSLSRQLKISEETTNNRIERTKQNMKEEFARQRKQDAMNRDTKSEDQYKVRMAMEKHQRDFLKSQERQRKARHDAAAKYTELLDSQLSMMRARSLSSLKETMTQKEKEMNAALFRQYGINAD